MHIGIPKEIKEHECRVALTPTAARVLIEAGHTVSLQTEAGAGSGFSNESYREGGVNILNSIEDVYEKADMIVKVKEPLESEYTLARPGQILFTYFHFASSRALTEAMLASKSTCIAYETVEKADGTLPLLTPMSEVAGRMSVQQGAKYLENIYGGCGRLLGGVPGVEAARVLIIGGGVVGTEAAKMSAGLGADVTLLDKNINRLRYLSEVLPANVRLLSSNNYQVSRLVPNYHLIIGAVLVPGAKAPHLITKSMLKGMKKGTVMVDVAVDQGGCFETTRATTHNDPTYNIDGIVHYAVANMPGAVPQTSTYALTNVTLPYILEVAKKGWKLACSENKELKLGLNIVNGRLLYPAVANAFQLSYESFSNI